MNREKRDKIPSMQVSFIDAICTQLYEVILSVLIIATTELYLYKKKKVAVKVIFSNGNGEHLIYNFFLPGNAVSLSHILRKMYVKWKRILAKIVLEQWTMQQHNYIQSNVFFTVTDLGWNVRVLLSIVGRMSEKQAAMEAFGWGVWERALQRLGVIPPQVNCVLPGRTSLTKFREISMTAENETLYSWKLVKMWLSWGGEKLFGSKKGVFLPSALANLEHNWRLL